MLANDVFILPIVLKLLYPDLVSWLLDTATLQEAHAFHSANWPDWVPGAARLRQHAAALTSGMKAAENKDRLKSKELEQEHADTLQSIVLNANYIAMRALHEKDESLLHNVGYTLKDKTKRVYGQLSIRTTPMALKVKNGPGSGKVTVWFEKDPAAGSYQLQLCKGAPAGEDSWKDVAFYKSCRNVIPNLDLASWAYFRGRSHGDNETSPWSAPVSIIVT